METVRFISCEDDGVDQILSFALAHGEADIKSLILLRTPKYEALLDETEWGISVSLEDETVPDGNMLLVFRLESSCVTIEAQASKHELDIGRVDPMEIAEMKALISRMNFDNRFRIEEIGRSGALEE